MQNKTDALSKLYQICKTLQKQDIDKGYHTGSIYHGNYMESYYAIFQDPKTQRSPFNLTEVLDDAWNCKLITIEEYDLIFSLITNTKR
jgi:hypothetical protein